MLEILASFSRDQVSRFYELVLVNGPAIKVLIEEEFGDGMSAIYFDMDITRKSGPTGDCVAIGMTEKFLPFKYYGPEGVMRWRMGWCRPAVRL